MKFQTLFKIKPINLISYQLDIKLINKKLRVFVNQSFNIKVRFYNN